MIKQPQTKARIRNIIILVIVVFCVSFALYSANALHLFELKVFDLYSRLLNPLRSSGNTVIIEVDQKSIDALSGEGINWPWPRQMYAPLIEYLSEADAVAVDVLYTEPSSYGQEDDAIFADAIRKASNVYLPFFLSKNPKDTSPEDMMFVKTHSIGEATGTSSPYRSVIVPLDVLRAHIKGTGNVAISPDEDGVYRKISLFFQFQNRIVPNLISSCLIKQGKLQVLHNKAYLRNTPVPLVDGKVLLRYYRDHRPFQVFSAVDILNAAVGKDLTKSVPIGKEYFKDKTVFVGFTAAGLYDLKPTSVSPVSTGVYINATLFDNLRDGSFMRPVNPVFVVLSMFSIVLFLSVFVLYNHSFIKNLAMFLGIFALVFGATALLFLNTRYFPVVYPLAALIIGFISAATFSYASEGKERLFIRKTFSQYMDKTLVNYVLQNPDIIKPGGKRLRVTVFFADIAGFTTISEKNSPEDTAMMLHTILDALTEVVIGEKGVIDKYIGDCIMAFWGAPLHTENDEINACQAGLNCFAMLRKINAKFEEQGIPPVSIRIGIHSGDAIAGNLGSTRLFDYTVVGDTVNLASRLESVNKVFRTNIIVSEKTMERTNNSFVFRELGLIAVKGKSESIRIYELIAEKGNAGQEVKEKIDLFREALTYHENGKFNDAIRLLDLLLERYPGDGPALFYKERCEDLLKNIPLTKPWNILKMTEK
ncbi:MAG: adenylate/guanylate cyclase domain-containing protein [Proteobacteria bacterium]|nr:adenylate/guanylate cyclase domain-containing protein [Pseudomonadota bacterium]